ncbi:phosphatase PAP2 family protein [Streptomyces sp. NPDC006743]|uniref:phosphatase PAP2 family protein n=1 Tax=Streptomyces sp. NPDC006743 TaxID=3154480 RepID=UPI00345738AB
MPNPRTTWIPVVLFVLITWQVVDHGPLLRADRWVSAGLLHPDRFSEVLSDLGNVQVAVPVLLVAAGCAAWRGRRDGAVRWWRVPLAAPATMAVLPVLLVPLKEWTARPGTSVMPPGTGYFPSGHTSTAVLAYGGAVIVLLPWLGTAPARRLAAAGGVVLVLAVSYGLVRRGYHWPLDVVAAWCLGLVLLTPLAVLSRSTRRSSSGTASPRSGPS